jgi:hypothetical protein
LEEKNGYGGPEKAEQHRTRNRLAAVLHLLAHRRCAFESVPPPQGKLPTTTSTLHRSEAYPKKMKAWARIADKNGRWPVYVGEESNTEEKGRCGPGLTRRKSAARRQGEYGEVG